MRWIIRGWPGPSADGLGPRLAPNRSDIPVAYVTLSGLAAAYIFPSFARALSAFASALAATASLFSRSSISIFSKNFQSAIVSFISFFRPPGPALAYFPGYLVCGLAVSISAISAPANSATVC